MQDLESSGMVVFRQQKNCESIVLGRMNEPTCKYLRDDQTVVIGASEPASKPTEEKPLLQISSIKHGDVGFVVCV